MRAALRVFLMPSCTSSDVPSLRLEVQHLHCERASVKVSRGAAGCHTGPAPVETQPGDKAAGKKVESVRARPDGIHNDTPQPDG